ncbi:Transposase_24 domain-containing protein [Cephalotus follicularis]|uniref:Transposase_24 domain-containing protein n=1 Tax=Cephalotus follicularis TaxID=3775 RepID=A0A1Q3B8K4_CEPFO|nr:Transposase_24 domain-containing protein [Cephalotus follicularis]
MSVESQVVIDIDTDDEEEEDDDDDNKNSIINAKDDDTIPDLISTLKSAFRPKILTRVESILRSRDEKRKQEMDVLRTENGLTKERLEMEKLMNAKLQSELQRCKDQISELQRTNSRLISERERNSEERVVEVKKEEGVVGGNQEKSSDKFFEVKTEVVNGSNDFPDAGARPSSQNVVEITDSDDDCVPRSMLNVKDTISQKTPGSSQSGRKRKLASYLNTRGCEDGDHENQAVSSSCKGVQKFVTPPRQNAILKQCEEKVGAEHNSQIHLSYHLKGYDYGDSSCSSSSSTDEDLDVNLDFLPSPFQSQSTSDSRIMINIAGMGHGKSTSRGGGRSDLTGSGSDWPSAVEADRPELHGPPIDTLDVPVIHSSTPEVAGSSSVASVRTRGPARGVNMPVTPALRPVRIVTCTGCFEDEDVKHQITVLVRDRFQGPYIHWSDWPQDERDCVWSKLQEYFNFGDSVAVARDAFERYCTTNYPKWLHVARKLSMKNAGKLRVLDERCKKFPPYYIRDHIWAQMVDKFLEPSFKEKQKIAAINRASEVYVLYTGGSMPMEKRMKKAEIDGKEFSSVYLDTHRKDGEDAPAIVQERVQKYKASIRDQSSAQASGENPRPTPFDPHAWSEATGGVRKGKIRGLGNYFNAAQLLGSHSTHRRASSVQTQNEVVSSHLQELVTQLVTQIMDQRSDGLEQRVDQKLDQRITEVVESVKHIVLSHQPAQPPIQHQQHSDQSDDDDDTDL